MADNSQIVRVAFDNQRAGLASSFFSTVHATNNEFLETYPEQVPNSWTRTGIWIGSGGANKSNFQHNKFGNENSDGMDVKVLVANPAGMTAAGCNDGTSTCPVSNQLPSAGVSSGVVSQNNFDDEDINGGSYSAALQYGENFLYTYSPSVYSNSFRNENIDGAPMPYLIYFDPVSGKSNTSASGDYTNICGPYKALSSHSLNPGIALLGAAMFRGPARPRTPSA